MERTFLYEDEHQLEYGYHDIVGVDGEKYYGRRYSKEPTHVKVIIDEEWLELVLKNNIDGIYECYAVTNVPAHIPEMFEYRFVELTLQDLKNIENVKIPFYKMVNKLRHTSVRDCTTAESFYKNNKRIIKEKFKN